MITPGPATTYLTSASLGRDPLFAEFKKLIVDTMKIDDVQPEDIRDDEPLFGSPRFGFDSIDALELVVKLEKEFGLKISSSEESRRVLASVKACVEFIHAKQRAAS